MERARNVDAFRWAGDPERWGASTSLVANVAAAMEQQTVFPIYPSSQLLRAQTEGLVALGWDLVATWAIDGLLGSDDGALALEFTIGTGQSTSTLLWLLSAIVAGRANPQNAGAATLGWVPSTTFATPTRQVGCAVSAQPIIACALGCRAVLQLGGTVAHAVKLDVTAHCAPRSWVP